MNEVLEVYYAYDNNEFDEVFLGEMIKDAIEEIKNMEFSTALKHAWLHNSAFI